MEPSVDSPADRMCQFVQGKLAVDDFEGWCYQSPQLESSLGKDLYLDLITTRFDDLQQVAKLKNILYEWLLEQKYPVCECFRWGALNKEPLGCDWTLDEVDARFELLRQRTNWLELRRCRRCGQAWYVACDTVDDDWYFRRMSEDEVGKVLKTEKWPEDFYGESKYGLSGW
jgi:hypothetical protein